MPTSYLAVTTDTVVGVATAVTDEAEEVVVVVVDEVVEDDEPDDPLHAAKPATMVQISKRKINFMTNSL